MKNKHLTMVFRDVNNYRSWVKKQVRTSFSVPVKTAGSNLAFAYVNITKLEAGEMRIHNNELIHVEIRKLRFSAGSKVFLEPMTEQAYAQQLEAFKCL